MSKISELKPEPIKYSTEERWAVFVIERQFQDKENITEKVTQCVGVFDSPSKAGDFIRENHRAGNHYFIAEGWCMG
jgi:hypothetical protein